MHQCLCTFKKSFGINLNFYAILNDFFLFHFSFEYFANSGKLKMKKKPKKQKNEEKFNCKEKKC